MLLKHRVNRILPHPGYNLGGGGDTTTVQKADPWGPSQPYLIQGMEDAQAVYNAQGGAAGIQPYTGDRLATMPDWLSQGLTGAVQQTGDTAGLYQQMMMGAMAPALDPEGNRADVAPMTTRAINFRPGEWQNPSQGSVTSPFARIEAGNNPDPYAAINSMLYGGTVNPFLADMASGITNQTMQAWGDMSRDTTEQLNTQILPGLENEFAQSGGLGQSRQALLQGQATGRTMDALAREGGELSSNLAGTLANMYGAAYDSDANRRAGLSQFLSGQDFAERAKQADLQQSSILGDISANASRDVAATNASASTWNNRINAILNAQTANLDARTETGKANLDARVALAGLEQDRDAAALTAASMLPGAAQLPLQLQQQMLSTYNPLLAQEQAVYDTNQQIYNETNAAPWDALGRYSSLINPNGVMGGTQSSTEPGNPLAGAIGGAAAGYGLWSSLPTAVAGFPALLPFTLGGALLGGVM